MSLGFEIALGLGMLAYAAYAAYSQNQTSSRRDTDGWIEHPPTHAAVKVLGLSPPFDRYWPVSGKVLGVAMDIGVKRTDGAAELVVNTRATVPVTLTLTRQRAVFLSADDLVLGEPRFDDVFTVSCPDELVARALLDGPTRDALARAGELGVTLVGQRWQLRAKVDGWTEAQVGKAIKALVSAHDALRARQDVASNRNAAVNGIVRTDRTANVRLGALSLLLARGIAERETLLHAMRDVDVNVSLLAAHALGPDGRDVLSRFARTGSRSVRVRAAVYLAESTTLGGELQLLVEDTLVSALDDEDADNVQRALLGLTRVGTARSVGPVQRLDQHGSREIRAMATGVLAALRSRLDPSASGAVSLIDEAGGELAVAAQGGEVAEARAVTR